MFLKCSPRKKDGKEHRAWSVVESRRVGRGGVQRHVLYLGEINDSQRAAWQKAIAVFDEHDRQTRQCALFPADRTPPAVQVQLSQLQLSRPRAWGACWLGDQLWRDLQLDAFFAARPGCSREGTDWEKVLRLLTLYRLLSPGSEWPLHRHWFAATACAGLLGADERLAQDDTLYRGLVGLLEHKDELFAHHKAERIEAHLFLAFLAYCLSITLRQRLKALAGGLMPRVVFGKLASLQLLDVRVPTTDGRELLLVRRTEPERDVALLLARLNLVLPPQSPPPPHCRQNELSWSAVVVATFAVKPVKIRGKIPTPPPSQASVAEIRLAGWFPARIFRRLCEIANRD